MNWLQAIVNEIKIAVRMTIALLLAGKRSDWAWLKDRHLRTGFLIALPIFFGGSFLTIKFTRNGAFDFLFSLGVAILPSIVWLGYSAWSRTRSESTSIEHPVKL